MIGTILTGCDTQDELIIITTDTGGTNVVPWVGVRRYGSFLESSHDFGALEARVQIPQLKVSLGGQRSKTKSR